MSVSNENSRIHAGVMQAHKKCAMKIKEAKKEKDDCCVKIFLMERLYMADTKP